MSVIIPLLSFLYILKKEKLNLRNIRRVYKAKERIESLNLFDEDYYLTNYLDVRKSNKNPLDHYIYHGWKENRSPSKKFDGNYYLRKYTDMKNSKTNPLVHYVLHGKEEGRFPNKNAEINSPQNIIKNLKKSLFQSNHQIKILKDKLDETNKNIKQINNKIPHLQKEKHKLKVQNDRLIRINNNLKTETLSLKQVYMEKDNPFALGYDEITFIIPYRKTNDPKREENVDITMNYLSKLGIKNLIISEQSNQSSEQFFMDKYRDLFDNFEYVFSYDDVNLFNKAQVVNRGVIKLKTPYFAMSDVDSLTEKKNIEMAVYLLNKGIDIVYPFNRLVKDIVDKKAFINDYDFKTVESPPQYREDADGGIVFWNKRSFINTGMMNEYFSGWGGEDNELLVRANLYGLKQIRIDDTLYHLYHPKDQNRPVKNIVEMNKLMQIKSKEELLQEISKWYWVNDAKKKFNI